MNVAIIPARGGSKRIPRKNIKFFFGKPMIAWSIEEAYKTNIFDRIIVSTDDEEIASVAKEFGAEVPFMRPPNLSGDIIGTGPVVKHAVSWINENIGPIDNVCTIYPTAPFLRKNDLLSGLRILSEGECLMTFSATTYAFPIQRAFMINRQGGAEMFYPENFHKRSQDLEQAYHDAGQFYWSKMEGIDKDLEMFSNQSKPILLERFRVQDIDTEEDWNRAELMFSMLRKYDEHFGK